MAKVIEFYVLDRLRGGRLSNPPKQRGMVIGLPPTETASETSELKAAQPPSSSSHD